MKLPLSLSGLLLIIASLASSVFAQDTVRIQADLKSAPRTFSLNVAPTGSGPVKWQATSNLEIRASDKSGGITVIDAGPFMGRLPVASTGQLITAEATLKPSAEGWMALGIGAPSLGSPAWGSGIYVIVTSTGQYTLAGNPDPADWTSKKTVRLKNGTIPDFESSRVAKLKLEYNVATNEVSLSSGKTQLVERLSLQGKGFAVDPSFAGFSGYGQIPGERVVEAFAVESSNSAPAPPAAATHAMQPAVTPAWWEFGQPVQFNLVGGRLAQSSVALLAKVTDVSGREVARDRIPRAQAESAGWSWSPPSPGFYEVAFSQVDATGYAADLGTAYSLRAPNGNTRTFLHTRQGFAVVPPRHVINGPVGQFGFTYTLNQKNIPLAKLVGFDLANIHPIPWGANFTNLNMAIEPVKGTYRWEILDPHVDALANAGITIAGQFCYTPLWASPHPEKKNINICVVEGTAYAPKDIDDYSRFVEAAVTRYKDRIRLWELWNEPAVPGGSVFWSDTPENFVRMMRAGYSTIKRVQPDSEVWFGGIGGRAAYYAFYNRILSLGGEPFFDVLSLHGNAVLADFRRIEKKYDVAPKPAVMSEWHAILQGNSQSSPILEENALSFRMMRNLLLQIKEGVTRSMFFEMTNLVDKEALLFAGDNKWFVHSSGLFRNRPQSEPRHAAVVMANFLNVSGKKAVFVKEVDVSENIIAVQLSTGRGPLLAFWSETADIPPGAMASFATPGSELVDWEGKTISTTTTLSAGLIYYLSSPNTEQLSGTALTNRLVPPQSQTRKVQQTVKGFYNVGLLFDSVETSPTVPDSGWINTDWTLTTMDNTIPDRPVSARAAVGVHEAGLDLLIEVKDSVHSQKEPQPSFWNGDSVQLAIDCEGIGLVGGHTELIAALGQQGPVLWKLAAADTRGDIPGQWSPANGPVKNAGIRITREGSVTRYQCRIAWAELYPLAYDNSKPIRLSLVVNNNDGSGRKEYLEWGGGIAAEKDPSAYGELNAPAR